MTSTMSEPIVSKKVEKVLLVSGTVPGEPGVGGVILRDLVEHIGFDRTRACLFVPRGQKERISLDELQTTELLRQYEPAFRPLSGIAGETLSYLAARSIRDRHMGKLASLVENEINSYKPDIILFVLESITSIEVSQRLINRVTVPIHCIVWDDVKLLCHQANLDRWTAGRLKENFGQVLKSSRKTAVICENMQQSYQQEYQINSIILRHGISSQQESLESNNTTDDIYRIGFAGSITAPDCMNSLIEALDQMSWRMNGRRVVLRLLGVRYLLDSRRPQHIEYFGWRDTESTSQLLAECDCLYLPQSFNSDLHYFSELSFPTKLSSYVVTKKPILLHSPEYSSLVSFWIDYSPGPHCSSLNPIELEQALQKVLTSDQKQTEAWILESEKIHNEVLSFANFCNSVDELVRR